MACRTKRLEKKPVLSDGVGTITKLASLFWMASLESIVAERRGLLAAINSLSCGSTIGILPAFRASTRVLLTSRPITAKPRLASTAASGAPSLPRPITETRGKVAEVISRSVLRAGTDTVGRARTPLEFAALCYRFAACAVPSQARKIAIQCAQEAGNQNESGIFGLPEGLLRQRGGLRRGRQATPGKRGCDGQGRVPCDGSSDRRQPLQWRQGPVADVAGPVRQGRSPDAARCREAGGVRYPQRRSHRRAGRVGGQCRWPEGGDSGGRPDGGKPSDAWPDRSACRAR